MRYPLVLIGVLSLASCAPTATTPVTQEQPKAPAAPTKPAVDYSALSYDAPEWATSPGRTCFINDFSMNYRLNVLNLRQRVMDFDPSKTDKSTSILIYNSISNSYQDIEKAFEVDYKRIIGDNILISSICAKEINSILGLRNMAIFDSDPIVRQYKHDMNRAEIIYNTSLSAIQYVGFYNSLLTSIGRRLNDLRSLIESR